MFPFSFWQSVGKQWAQSKGKKHFHSTGPRADPLGEMPLLSHGAFNTGRATAIHCGVGDWGKKAIYLDWGWRGKHSPVPLLLSLPLLRCPLPAAPRLAGLTLQQPVGSRGFVSVRMLTRSSKLPHKHKHQRAGMCVFWSSFLGFTGL